MYQLLKLLKQFLVRSEEHTSELQSHSEISYAVFCLKKKKQIKKLLLTDRAALEKLGHRAFAFVVVVIYKDVVFFFNDTATTEIYTNLNTLSLHDALPI